MSSESLPVLALREPFLDALREDRRVILRAPTGSGKSTQAPQMLLDSGMIPEGKQIVVLQPRRLAARMLARRIAEERGGRLGEEVGYQVRFENVSGRNTRILLVTEGILLRKWMRDPDLEDVGAVLIDEFHERHLNGDLLLGIVRQLQERNRSDLKLAVMSATLEPGPLEEFLEPCRVVESEGRMFPVDVEYLTREPGDRPVWELAADAVRAAFPFENGHALVFMPGSYEIQRTVRLLQQVLPGNVPVLPLHGELPVVEQDAAVGPGSSPRVIVATNVAETSITIDGVTLVVDGGLARVARFDATRGINTLYIEKISKASAAQRTGRAGRTRAGKAIRLWTERDHSRRPDGETPEIHRVDLSETFLMLASGGVPNPGEFPWYEPPADVQRTAALRLLEVLGALGSEGLTDVGRSMSRFPCHPRFARMFLAAGELGCAREAALIAAITQGRPLLVRGSGDVRRAREELIGDCDSDFVAAMRGFAFAQQNRFRTDACRPVGIHADASRQVARAFQQFLGIVESLGIEEGDGGNADAIAKCVLVGFPDHVGRLRSRAARLYDVAHGRSAKLPAESFADGSELVVAGEMIEIERRGEVEVTLGMACRIEEAWLEELYPHDFSNVSSMVFDPLQKRVVERVERRFCDVVLARKDRQATPGPEAAECLAQEVVEGRIQLKHWNESVDRWIRRYNFLSEQMPELELSPIDETARFLILSQICEGAVSGRDLKERTVLPAVQQWLPASQRDLMEKFVPERIELPGNRRGRFHYPDNEDPYLAARIQDLYDLREIPPLCAGRFRPAVHILAPNNRPVQVTRDLSNFWKEHYPALKGELSRRYPKHEWR